MKKIIYCLVAAMLLAACEKDNPVVDDPATGDNPVVSKVWNIPANLPNNIVDIMADVPCWKTYEVECGGVVKDGKAVIENITDQRLDGGGSKQTFKFHKTMVYDKYWYNTVPGYSENTQHYNEEWSKIQILEYKDGKIVFARGDLTTEGAHLSIYFLEKGTQERLDEVLADLPNDTDK